MQSFYSAGALALLVFANSILGSSKAIIDGTFDKGIAKKGLFKALLVTLSIGLTYGAGYLMPDLSVITFNGAELTLSLAIQAILTAAVVYYGGLDLKKIIEILQVPISIETGPDKHI